MSFTPRAKDINTILLNSRAYPEDYVIGQGVKFERIRRITGYLVGTLDRFNDGKAAEERDRVKHMSFNRT